MRQPIAVSLAVIAVAACGSADHRAEAVQTRPSPVVRSVGGPPAHIAVVVMENEESSDVLGSGAAPFINRLAATYATARASYAVSHPSLPNYLALTGGSTFGIDSDCTDCTVRATNLVDQLDRRRVSWKAYMEDLPRPCFTDPGAGEYAKKHDPFLYYADVAGNPARCKNVVPLSQLAADQAARRLPRLIWITPNLCHDMHDCDVSTGDRFLARLVPALLAALGPRGLLFLTWDEGTSEEGCCRLAAGGHVVTIAAGGLARRHAAPRTPVDHYSLLQTVEDLLGLPRLRDAACACTPSLGTLLRTAASPRASK
jgi:hypothetical protein